MAITSLFVASAEWGTMAEWAEVSAVATRTVASNTQAHTGAYAYRLNTTSNGYGYRTIPATRQVRLGAWVYPGQKGTAPTAPLFGLFSAGGAVELVTVRLLTGTAVGLYVGGVLVGSVPYTVNTWQHWAIDVKVDSSAGWASFYIDGAEVAADTGNTGNADIEHIRLGTSVSAGFSAAAYTYVDDFYLDDTSGEGAPATLPDRRFVLTVPTADSGPNDWTVSTGTNHYAVLDDIPPAEATYIEAGSAGLEDLFTVGAPSIPAGLGVARLWVQAVAQRTDAGIVSQYTLAAGGSESDTLTPSADFEMQMAVFDTTNTSQEFGVISAGAFA